MTTSQNGPLRVGVGGPVGTGKTALMDALCKQFRSTYDIAAITNDIYTKEDAEFLTRAGSLPPERILGIETGGCPHTAIREDASINLAGVADLRERFPALDLVLIESGDTTATHAQEPAPAEDAQSAEPAQADSAPEAPHESAASPAHAANVAAGEPQREGRDAPSRVQQDERAEQKAYWPYPVATPEGEG